MPKKHFFTVIFFLMIFCTLFAEDVFFKVIKDTPVWTERDTSVTPLTDSTVTRMLNKDAIVSNVSEPFIVEINGVLRFIHSISYENSIYYIPANTFTALDTEEIFDESFLTSADQQAKIWINAYFLDVMRTGNRDILMPNEQRLVVRYEYEEYERWYNFGDFAQSLVITQGTVNIGGLASDTFWIQQIKRTSYGYRVTVAWNTERGANDGGSELRSMKVNLPERNRRNRDTISNLFFVFDGDYIDVYYSTDMDNSHRTFCTSFARIDSEIRKQLDGIIRDISYYPDIYVPYNPSKITFWPRRADGSMDYPPPADMSGFSASRRTTDRLRLRDNPATASLIVTTLESGTEVQVLETGPSAVIDGITAPWCGY